MVKKHALLCAIAVCVSLPAWAQNVVWPPRHPLLVDGLSQMTHFEPSNQDSTPVAGPIGVFEPAELNTKIAGGGLVNIAYVSGHAYPNGQRVIWLINNNRIAKVRVDGGRFDEVAHFEIDPSQYISPQDAVQITAELDAAQEKDATLITYMRDNFDYYMEKIGARSGTYPIMGADGRLYVLVKNSIRVYQEQDSQDPASPIEEVDRFDIPDEMLNGRSIAMQAVGDFLKGDLPLSTALALAMGVETADFALGMSMSFDGHIIFTMFGGTVGVIRSDFEGSLHTYRFDDERITNSFAMDEEGGLYIVTSEQMHKLVWTGKRLSAEVSDGAWSSPYPKVEGPIGGMRGASRGSGSSPSLMGFGPGEDKLVVITDGSKVMNLVAFWRDAIPADAQEIEGLSKRIAGLIQTQFGQPDLSEAQSEQSVAVMGNQAVVVNNAMPNPGRAAFESIVATGVTRSPAWGVEAFSWDHSLNAWQRDWARADINSPSTVPLISGGANSVYVNGIYDGVWEITGLSMKDGSTTARLKMGASQVFNGAYSQIQMLPQGDLVFGGFTGVVRISAP